MSAVSFHRVHGHGADTLAWAKKNECISHLLMSSLLRQIGCYVVSLDVPHAACVWFGDFSTTALAVVDDFGDLRRVS